MVDREQIGMRIAALRRRAGLSQAALAGKLGISAQAVSKWESGRNLPDIDLFRELAWLFNMTIDSIVEGDLSFVQKSGQKKLPASVEALIPDAERRKVLQSLALYSSDTELYSFAKEMSAGRLELSLAAGVVRRNEKLETDFQRVVSIPASAMEEGTLRETAPYFSKALGGMIGGDTEPGLRRIAELMRCPECGEGMRLETDTDNRIGLHMQKRMLSTHMCPCR